MNYYYFFGFNTYIFLIVLLEKAKPEVQSGGDTGRLAQLKGAALAQLKKYEDAKRCYMVR